MNKHFQYALNGNDFDNNEEDYLDPNELEIINDETWEPTDEDIFLYASKLGFDIENDPDELFEIAYSFLKYPIPLGWQRVIYKATKELMYMNMETGEIEGITEIEEMARQVYEERKNEMIQRGLIHITTSSNNNNNNNNNTPSSAANVNKVVPNKKISPITKSLNKQNADISSIINKDNCNDDEHIKCNDMSRSSYDDSGDSDVYLQQSHITSKSKPTAATTTVSTLSLQNMQKEYLNSKLNELKAYEKQLRDNYYKSIKVYKSKEQELLLSLGKENKT